MALSMKAHYTFTSLVSRFENSRPLWGHACLSFCASALKRKSSIATRLFLYLFYQPFMGWMLWNSLYDAISMLNIFLQASHTVLFSLSHIRVTYLTSESEAYQDSQLHDLNSFACQPVYFLNMKDAKNKLNNITGVAKFLDNSSHFLKFEIFREPQLNTYLKDTQKKSY